MDYQIEEIFNYTLEDKDELYARQERRLLLNTEVNDFTIASLVYMIIDYNREDKGLPVEERKPIVIYINSVGGAITSAFSLIDIIEQSITPVYTVNLGICYSAAFLIFIAGKKRYSLKRSTFLCHDGISGAVDSMAKLKDRIEFETNQVEAEVKDYVLKNTTISNNIYEDKYRTEWYMFPKEAKKNGVVTHIVGDDCDIEEIL